MQKYVVGNRLLTKNQYIEHLKKERGFKPTKAVVKEIDKKIDVEVGVEKKEENKGVELKMKTEKKEVSEIKVEDEEEKTLEMLQDEYKDTFNKELPARFKNDARRIKNKLYN